MANEALTKIKEIIRDLKTLEIVTVVTNITSRKDDDGRIQFLPEEKTIEKGCVTIIDLIEGDIRNYVGPGLAGEEYDQITNFHARQVEKGYEVIKSNISGLKDIAKLIKELASE